MSHRHSPRPRFRLVRFLSRLTLAFLVAGAPLAFADESRFDPPLGGAFLGVQAVEASGGLRLVEVYAGGAAERAGLRSGDVLLEAGRSTDLAARGLEGLAARGLEGLAAALEACGSHEPLEVIYLRDDERHSVTVHVDPALARDALEIARRLRSLPLFRAHLPEDLEGQLIGVVRSSPSTQAAYNALNRAIDAFGISHSAVIPPWTSENLMASDTHRELGLYLQEVLVDGEVRYFVQDLLPGSVSHRSSLAIGDELIRVNGVPYAKSPRRVLAGYEARREIYTIALDPGERVLLETRRRREEPVRELELASDIAPDIRRATRASVDRLECARGLLGSVRLWNLLSREIVSELRSILREDLRDARGLIIDLRGRGGRVDVLLAVAKLLREDGRPLALLIDRETRSAKEVLAHLLKGEARVTLIGETTAGAVRPATTFRLASGAQVMLPVGDGRQVLRYTEGVDLEARGIEPDIVVPFSLPWAAGEDPLRERAREVLEQELAKPRRQRV